MLIIFLVIIAIAIASGLLYYNYSIQQKNINTEKIPNETNNIETKPIIIKSNSLFKTLKEKENKKNIKIVYVEDSSITKMAASELRKYIYLRTRNLYDIEFKTKLDNNTDIILIGSASNSIIANMINKKLNKQSYLIKSIKKNTNNILLISGYDKRATLNGVYRFAELMGISYGLEGDIIPEDIISLNIENIDELSEPLFEIRGIQPFHDFPTGPDMWNTDDYMLIITQLAKLGMNFIGLHTYGKYNSPYDGTQNFYRGPEPTVWIGTEDDINTDGTPKWSYPSTYFTTHSGTWGYQKMDTKDFSVGANNIFENDIYGSEIMGPNKSTNTQDYNNMYIRAAKLFKKSFKHAKKIGVLTATGTELPLGTEKKGGSIDKDWIRGIPKELQERLKGKGEKMDDNTTLKVYKGIFKYIMKNYPIDYYWLWLYEIWSGSSFKKDVTEQQKEAIKKDILLAKQALDELGNPFKLGIAGWILGSWDEPALLDNILPPDVPFMSLWGSAYGYEKLKKERKKWPTSYLEYDRGLIEPQFAVYRIHEDTLASFKKGGHALINKMWRTRMMSPNINGSKELLWLRGKSSDTIVKSVPTDLDTWMYNFYNKWVISQFGNNNKTKELTDIFFNFEKEIFPKVVDWDSGIKDDFEKPGAIIKNKNDWNIEKNKFNFVDKMINIKKHIVGKGNNERYDYWLNSMKIVKKMGEFGCIRYLLDKYYNNKEYSKALVERIKLARVFEDIITLLLEKTYNISDMGEIINMELLNWKEFITNKYDKVLKEKNKNTDAMNLSKKYKGSPKIIILNQINQLYNTDKFNITIATLGIKETPELYISELGKNKFTKHMFTKSNRNIYKLTLQEQTKDFEYYVKAGNNYYPKTHPIINNNVIIVYHSKN